MNKRGEPTDRKIILQYLEGNKIVLPLLVKRYHKIFCERAFWIVKDKEKAKDIAQESWLIIIGKLDTLEKLDSFKSWALRVVYHKSLDEIRRRNNENDYINSIKAVESDNSSVEMDWKNQTLNSLMKAIRDLPKDKQDVIRLFYAEEYTLIEISSFLNIPVGTVKSRLFKAREKLKKILKK